MSLARNGTDVILTYQLTGLLLVQLRGLLNIWNSSIRLLENVRFPDDARILGPQIVHESAAF